MFDLNRLSDEDQKLLQEIAKAKGKTLDEVLIEAGHKPVKQQTNTPQDDEVAVFEAAKPEPVAKEEVPVVEAEKQPEPELPPPAPEEEENNEPEQIPGMATMRSVCSHCGWDQAISPIPEPDHSDKLIFLQAILGQKVFSKRFLLFNNNLRITFRSLTVREIDALYTETFKAQKAGLIETASDYYEYLNRQRLYLQLIGVSSNQTALHITLPDGYTKETHPDAESYWDDFLAKENLYVKGKETEDNSLMQKVQDYVLSHVLKTEHLQRTINHTCARFNRLVAKLEANVDNENFWSKTEPPY